MPMLRRSLALALLVKSALLVGSPAAAVGVDWLPIANPGNACDMQSQGCFGSVSADFSIARTEVTNAQYAEFLNAVARDDTHGLYCALMATGAAGGIARTGSPGSYEYAAKPGFGALPAAYVSFWNALRFANWLGNRQPIGPQGPATTEGGAYTITPEGVAANAVARNPGSRYFLPSEDEWYKAAYYAATSSSYFDYPTASDVPPLCAGPGATANTANCGGAHGQLTAPGSYTGSASPSGTLDQGGNVWEWTETVTGVENRVLRGGSFDDNSSPSPQGQHNLSALRRFYNHPGKDDFAPLGMIGFRVAALPEPGTAGLAAGIALLTALCATRGKRVPIRGYAALIASAALLAGPPASGQVSCPPGGDLTTPAALAPGLLPDEAVLAQWQKFMVDLGPRFTGSPANRSWHDFLASQLAATGLSVVREPIPLEWWLHERWSLKLIQNGVETDVPVSSYYPYSGSTPEGGIVAELVDAGVGAPEDFAAAAGKIAFYEENMLSTDASIFYAVATYVHDPDHTLTPATDYKRASVSFLTPQEESSLTSAKTFGAVGAIVSYEASRENAAGQYTPFLTNPGASQGVPTLYVDRATGNMIKAKIAEGAQARLELVVAKHPGDATDDIVATLPGTNPNEVILFNTHTDGTSASEENGALGILSMARYFASLPQSCRQRTIVIALTPGHFNNGIGGDTARFIDHHAEIIAKSVASVTVEHLGQTEWVDDGIGFHPTGYIEPGAFFGSASAVQTLIANAVIAEDLRRTFVMRPYAVIYFGVGSALNAAGVPNAAFITGPNMMLSFADNQHVDKVDYHRMAAEIRTATRIAASMDATPTATLCAGMSSQDPGSPTGCSAAAP
jgi:formylglycine-generating enzyme required for sulfatase activity